MRDWGSQDCAREVLECVRDKLGLKMVAFIRAVILFGGEVGRDGCPDLQFISRRLTVLREDYEIRIGTDFVCARARVYERDRDGGVHIILLPHVGLDGTADSESALRSAGTLLPRVRAPPPALLPDGGPESLR
ncbi:hypothetical protein PoB_004680800 [Plakobranchus ocellatus]|uniref:Uncharacterized protein n=1 Tax=Plakobranchus ocellatus TaxID=259542 RepID=A0AAV4BL56_9GAST|nr:hypothetical protein PoB_004680800 [Plakobranchus ocellatus]